MLATAMVASSAVWLACRFAVSACCCCVSSRSRRSVRSPWLGIVNLGGGVATGMIGGSSVARVEGGGLVGTGAPSYKGFRFPAEIISHCVWLYYRFPLSFREVEEMMLQRGIMVSHETVRRWCASSARPTPTRCAAAATSRGHVAPRRGVHQDQRQDALSVAGGGPGRQRLDILVSPGAAPRPRPGSSAGCSRAWQYVPRVVVTDKLASYGAAHRRYRQRRAPRQGAQQPGRKLPPADPPARTGHAPVQVTRARAAVPLGLQRDISPLPTSPSSTRRQRNTDAK